MENIILHTATLNDLDTIKAIGEKGFSESFAHLNTKENMAHYLATSFNKDKLTAEINNPNSFFYLLYCNSDCAGYLKLNIMEAQTESGHDTALEIERIYVLNKYQGKQLGKLLLNQAIEKARQLSKDYIWLGVWEKNEKAIGFYEKSGFEKLGAHLFKLGDEEQTDYLYKLNLKTVSGPANK